MIDCQKDCGCKKSYSSGDLNKELQPITKMYFCACTNGLQWIYKKLLGHNSVKLQRATYHRHLSASQKTSVCMQPSAGYCSFHEPCTMQTANGSGVNICMTVNSFTAASQLLKPDSINRQNHGMASAIDFQLLVFHLLSAQCKVNENCSIIQFSIVIEQSRAPSGSVHVLIYLLKPS